MPTFAVLLRGVNVGGANLLPMAGFRAMLEELGFAGVATYIQSGNAVVTSKKATAADVEKTVKGGLAKTFGLEVPVAVRTSSELAAVAKGHPFGAAEPNRVHVVFLSGAPTAAAIASLDPRRSPQDRWVVRGRELYLHTPDGMGKSKVTMDWLERCLGVSATARNWNTVETLARLTRGGARSETRA